MEKAKLLKTDIEPYLREIKLNISRLDTFSLLSNKDFWNNDWHTFRVSNMLYNMQYAIASQDVPVALLLLKRHVKDDQVIDQIPKLVYDIPKSMNLDKIFALLEEFCRIASNNWELRFEWSIKVLNLPNREEIDQWILNTADAIERVDKNPEKALDLLNWSKNHQEDGFLSGITPMTCISQIEFQSKKRMYRDSNVPKKIQARIKQLTSIMELAASHHFTISLQEYVDFTAADIGILVNCRF